MLQSRREFIKSAALLAPGALLMAEPLFSWADQSTPSTAEKETPVAEDLMREHGGLNRILLIYEESLRRLDEKRDFDSDALKHSAGIIRDFIEGYHEKLEEEYLFPRFEKAGKLTSLTQVLRTQHNAGRRITELILELSKPEILRNDSDRLRLQSGMRSFIRMYRPHEAREDTVLFPAFKALVSAKEYEALGECFEDREHELFGQEGFERIIADIADIEKRLGIYDLNQFTP